MNRRELLTTAAGAAAFMTAGAAFAADHDHDHEGHDHEGHEHAGHSEGIPNAKLVQIADDCAKAGQVCLSHCLDLAVQGDNSLAGCAMNVNQMTAVCTALSRLAASASRNLPGMAKVAYETCKDCEAECRKHEHHHAVCKACAESCAACAEECKKVMA